MVILIFSIKNGKYLMASFCIVNRIVMIDSLCSFCVFIFDSQKKLCKSFIPLRFIYVMFKKQE